MKLTKVVIKGFRSYGSKTILDFSDLTTLIGDNGAGKTTALIALNKMFSSNASDRIIRSSDFYSPINEDSENSETKEFSCDAYFQFGDEDSRVEAALLKRACIKQPNGSFFLHICLEAKWIDDGSADGATESKIWFVTDDVDPGNIRRYEAPRRELNLIRMIYVPAVRNPEKQLGATSNSLLARLVRSVNWKPESRVFIEKQLKSLNQTLLNEDGLKEINDTLSTDWQNYYQDERFANVALTLDSTNLGSLANRVRSTFTSKVTSHNFRPEEMGDGTRSLFYISNVASVLDIEQRILEQNNDESEILIKHQPPLLTLVAIEEPENHISPHLLGKLIRRLKDMDSLENCQVLLTSHSPAIVRRIDPESIRFVRLDSSQGFSTIQRLSLPERTDKVEAYRYVKLAVQAYPELYFSQLVVFGEGASEEILIPRFLEAKNYPLDETGITFVPLAGRFVHYLWRLLAQLKIPFITLLDLDRERSGGGWGRVSYVLGELQKIGKNVTELPEGMTELTEKSLNELAKCTVEDVDSACTLEEYLQVLEKQHVYFSGPLDIDYLMLSHYSENYKKILHSNEGPKIITKEGSQKKVLEFEPDNMKNTVYVARAQEATKSALKDGVQVTSGNSYSAEQKALMIWYVYFFLGRGKTATHVQVLYGDEFNREMTNSELVNQIPPVIDRLCDDVAKLLNLGV